MKSKFLLFVFFFSFLFLVSSVSSVEVGDLWFENIQTGFLEQQCFHLDSYFTAYDSVNISTDYGDILLDSDSSDLGILDVFDEYGSIFTFYLYPPYFGYGGFLFCTRSYNQEIDELFWLTLSNDTDSLGNPYTYSTSESAPYPEVIDYVPDFDLGHTGAIAFNTEDYFKYYNLIEVSYNSTIGGGTMEIINVSYGEGSVCTGDYKEIYFCLVGEDDTIYLQLYSNQKNVTDLEFLIRAISYNGFAYDYFLVDSTNVPDQYSQIDIPVPDSSTRSFIGYFNSWLDVVFPNSDSLTSKKRFGYVFLTALLINFLMIYGLSRINAIKFGAPLLIVLDGLLLFYFIAIGYIPLALIIVVALVCLGLLAIKFKGGG